MRYHERLNIVFMRDNGPRRSLRVRRNHFYLALAFFGVLPFICGFLAWACWHLWQGNLLLLQNVEKFEADYQAAESRAERLENLEALLEEENVSARETLLRRLASGSAQAELKLGPENEQERAQATEGPGHEEFPVIDSGKIKVGNVTARAIRGNRIRISLDLQNVNPETVLSGDVKAILVTPDGEEKNLVFMPEDVGNFRINRFKRSVMTARVPNGASLADAQIVIEVRNPEGGELFRNIYQIVR